MRRSLPVLSRPLWRSASNRPRPPGKVLSTRSTKSRIGGTDFGGLGGSATFFKTRDAVLSTRRGADKAERAAAAAAAGAGSGLVPSPAFLASVAPRVSHHAHHVLYGFGFRLR